MESGTLVAEAVTDMVALEPTEFWEVVPGDLLADESAVTEAMWQVNGAC